MGVISQDAGLNVTAVATSYTLDGVVRATATVFEEIPQPAPVIRATISSSLPATILNARGAQ